LAERLACILTFPNGDLTPGAADALAYLADLPGLSVRIGNDHRVFIVATRGKTPDELLANNPSLWTMARPQPSAVACPGTRWCGRALADTNNVAGRIRAALADTDSGRLTIAVSGCPNGCAASAVADIGIIGGRSSTDGQAFEKYAIMIRGGRGSTDALAQPHAAGLSADQAVLEVVYLAGTLEKSSPV
jgi:sulfite reductase (NADPH) hemoprotein beta-component